VLHGKAAMREDVRRAVRAVRDEGLTVDVRVTWEGGDASRFASEGALDGIRRTLVGARLSWLEIQTEEPLQINLDGEPLTDTRFRFEILPRRLHMRLPASCPLLG
jgi:diacylglycerol kinase family enzyme